MGFHQTPKLLDALSLDVDFLVFEKYLDYCPRSQYSLMILVQDLFPLLQEPLASRLLLPYSPISHLECCLPITAPGRDAFPFKASVEVRQLPSSPSTIIIFIGP